MSADSKVRTTLQNSIKHSGSERVKKETILYLWSLRNTENKNKRKGAGERSEWTPLALYPDRLFSCYVHFFEDILKLSESSLKQII